MDKNKKTNARAAEFKQGIGDKSAVRASKAEEKARADRMMRIGRLRGLPPPQTAAAPRDEWPLARLMTKWNVAEFLGGSGEQMSLLNAILHKATDDDMECSANAILTPKQCTYLAHALTNPALTDAQVALVASNLGALLQHKITMESDYCMALYEVGVLGVICDRLAAAPPPSPLAQCRLWEVAVNMADISKANGIVIYTSRLFHYAAEALIAAKELSVTACILSAMANILQATRTDRAKLSREPLLRTWYASLRTAAFFPPAAGWKDLEPDAQCALKAIISISHEVVCKALPPSDRRVLFPAESIPHVEVWSRMLMHYCCTLDTPAAMREYTVAALSDMVAISARDGPLITMLLQHDVAKCIAHTLSDNRAAMRALIMYLIGNLATNGAPTVDYLDKRGIIASVLAALKGDTAVVRRTAMFAMSTCIQACQLDFSNSMVHSKLADQVLSRLVNRTDILSGLSTMLNTNNGIDAVVDCLELIAALIEWNRSMMTGLLENHGVDHLVEQLSFNSNLAISSTASRLATKMGSGGGEEEAVMDVGNTEPGFYSF